MLEKNWNLRGWKQEETQGANLDGKKENIMASGGMNGESRRKRKEPRKKTLNFLLLCLRICLVSSIKHWTRWRAVLGIVFFFLRKVSEDDGKKFVDFLIGVNGDLNGIIHALSHVARYAKARSGILLKGWGKKKSGQHFFIFFASCT